MGAAVADAGRSGAAAAHGYGPQDTVTRRGLALAVFLLFGVSGGLLWEIGYNYDGLIGSALTKIHPSTYLVFLLTFWRSFTFGNPLRYAALVASRRPAATLMALVAALLLIVNALRGRPGIAGLVDSYMTPALFAYLLSEADESEIADLAKLLHVMMTMNAFLGLFEFATHTLLFPYRFDGEVFPIDGRSSALQGHPLVNAGVTAIYIMGLLSGARSLSTVARVGMIVLQCAALVTFGGRTSMIVTIALGGFHLLLGAVRALLSNRISLVGAAAAALAATILPALIALVIYSGAIDGVLARFVSDGGSANARVAMFDLFQYVSLGDLIVGPDTEFIDDIRRVNGLEQGIENPIVRLLLYQGVFATFFLLLSIFLFAREVLRGRWPDVTLAVVTTAVLLNASETIAVKTTMLAKIAIIFVCLFGARRQPRGMVMPSASSMAGSNWRAPSSSSPMALKRHQKAQGKPKDSAARRTSLT